MSDYTYVLYHGNCYDGFGAAWAAWLALGDKATYIPVLYGHAPPVLPRDAEVLICDFSYDRDTLLSLKEQVASLYVIDHHKTAMAALDGLDFAEFDMDHSGAYLTWVHFHGSENEEGIPTVPAMILYLEDRDLWRFALPDSKDISQALRAYPMDFDTWDRLSGDMRRLAAEGLVVERLTNQMVGLMCDHVRWQTLGGFLVPVANATVFFSEVGEELCIRFPDAPFAGYYMDRGDGLRQWGLRSRGGFDVSEVAKTYGGGGHAAASGWTEEIK